MCEVNRKAILIPLDIKAVLKGCVLMDEKNRRPIKGNQGKDFIDFFNFLCFYKIKKTEYQFSNFYRSLMQC